MSTGAQIVNDAAYACGALGQGDALSADDSALILRRLNRMMDTWSNLRSSIYEVVFDSFAAVAGQQQYSSALLLSVGRPVRVDSMYARLNNVDYPIALIGPEEWAEIPYKPVNALPRRCWVDSGMPNTMFNLFPVPDQVYTIFVGAVKPLPNTIANTTVLSLPPGYERAIVDNLAVDIAPSFGRQVTPDLRLSASNSKRALESTNFDSLLMDDSLGEPHRYSLADFYRGV